MALRDRLAGTHKRDLHTEKALSDAAAASSRGLHEFTITVHSTDGGLALMPRLTPHVISVLQENGYQVTNVSVDEWAYNAHLTVRTT